MHTTASSEISEMKRLAALESDGELAAFLNTKANNVASWRRRSVPEKYRHRFGRALARLLEADRVVSSVDDVLTDFGDLEAPIVEAERFAELAHYVAGQALSAPAGGGGDKPVTMMRWEADMIVFAAIQAKDAAEHVREAFYELVEASRPKDVTPGT